MTRLFNGSTQPRVIAWGEGVVMPGESFETDNPEGYAPDQPGSPWTTDAEATQALLSGPDPSAGDTTETAPEGQSVAPVTPEAPPEGPTLHTLDNGDVVNEAGEVIGHENPPPAPGETIGGNA